MQIYVLWYYVIHMYIHISNFVNQTDVFEHTNLYKRYYV
jgi:hypothetical protein